MCTAVSFNAADHYFGRNLDLDRSYGEEVAVMPRRFPIRLRSGGELSSHYAMIGMATVVCGTPLFYEATNECGLSAAGLNFPRNAYYGKPTGEGGEIASFELIPWLLGKCRTVGEAEAELSGARIVDTAFSDALAPSPLHWIISDKERSVTLEAMRDGLHIYENPVGVLTNNPPFPRQMENLKKYSGLVTDNEGAVYEENESFSAYCQGLGAVGLPGDVSSMSRFVRAVFGKENSVTDGDEESCVGQFFHILSSVSMLRGICRTDEGTLDITGYSSCANTRRGLYYYTTYKNRRISCVDMHKTELDGENIARFPLGERESIDYRN